MRLLLSCLFPFLCVASSLALILKFNLNSARTFGGTSGTKTADDAQRLYSKLTDEKRELLWAKTRQAEKKRR